MNFLRKIFKSKEPQPSVQIKKEKTSFLTWLCASKPKNEYQQTYDTGLKSLNEQSSVNKSNLSLTQTNNTKIVQSLSFGHQKSQYDEGELRGLLIRVIEKNIGKIQDLIQKDEVYAIIKSDQIMIDMENNAVWIPIGKNQQLNSLYHIKPYYFDKIFMVFDQFGGQYSIEEILKCSQNICIRLQNKNQVQAFIDSYEKELVKHFAFRPMAECFNKLKITVFRTKTRQSWLNFNQQACSDIYVQQILTQIGFDSTHEQYEGLKQQIPQGLTLQQYIDIIEHKQKLESKYQGQSVGQYIKNKFLQNISRKVQTPRNDSPRTVEDKAISDKEEQYDQYIISVTENVLSKQNTHENKRDGCEKKEKIQNNSYEEQIFDFNVYKDQKQQQARRIAINRERKKRSRSEDVTINEIGNDLDIYQSDFFDQKQ